MKPGPPKGTPKTPGSGRKKGTGAGSTINRPLKPGIGYVRELMEQLGVNTFEEMVKIARGEVECTRCHGAGELQIKVLSGVKVKRPKLISLTCKHCLGTKLEPIDPRVSSRIWAELGGYQQPKLSHVSHIGTVKVANGDTLETLLNTMNEATRDDA